MTVEKLKSMNPRDAQMLIESIVEPNPLLSLHKTHMVQLSSPEMDQFGDVVIVIKDEQEFGSNRIHAIKLKVYADIAWK